MFFFRLRDDGAAFEFVDAFGARPFLLGLVFEACHSFEEGIGALPQVSQSGERHATCAGEDGFRRAVPTFLRGLGSAQEVAATSAHLNDADAGEVEPQFPLRLEFGPFAGTDPDLTRLAVDANLGGAGPLQSDIHGEPNCELLPGDAPFRLQGSEPVEFADRRRVEVAGLFPHRGGLAFQRSRLLGVLACGVERLGGCPCCVQRRKVAGAMSLHPEVFDFVAVTGRGGPCLT